MLRFSIKPVFIAWSTLLAQLPLQLFFTVWGGIFFGGMLETVMPDTNAFVLFGAAIFFAIPLFIYVSKRFNYSRTEYRFFDDRLEFEEGFFTIQKKTIRFKDVKEVSLRRGILQRVNGLGTVYLATLATGAGGIATPFAFWGTSLGFGNASASGILVRDVKDPDTQYEKIRVLIDAHN